MPTVKIDGSSGRDVSAELQAVIDQLAPKAVLDFPCGTRYRCESTINFGLRPITVHANEAMIYATTPGGPSRATVRIDGAGVTIDRLIAAGTKAPTAGYDSAFEGQHAFNLANARDAHLTDCQGRDVRGDIVYVSGTRSTSIDRLVGVRCGRAWCSIISGSDVTFDAPVLHDAGRSGFNFEPHNATNTVDRFTVARGVFGAHRLNLVAMYGDAEATINAVTFRDGTHLGSGLNVVVQGSPIAGHWTRTNLQFLRNVSDFPLGNSKQAAMQFVAALGVTIVDNVQPMGKSRGMRMASFVRSSGYLVERNIGDNLAGQVLAA